MKIAVVDDEEKVCRLICALIEWDRLGCKLAGTAADGEDGLEMIKTVRPDVLITDIRMPGLDGLTMIAKAKYLFPDMHIIIISGYSQFDYAQAAIRYGVVNYLLKPIKKQELNAILQKIKNDYALHRKETGRIKKLEAEIRQTTVERQKTALRTAGEDKAFCFPDNIPFPIPSGIILIKPDSVQEPYDTTATALIEDRLEIYLHTIMKHPYIFTAADSFFILAYGTQYNTINYADMLLAWCKKQCELFRNFTLTIAIGTPVMCQAELYDSIQSAIRGLSCRLDEGTLKIYHAAPPTPAMNITPYTTLFRCAVSHEDGNKYCEALNSFKDAVGTDKLTAWHCESAVQQIGKELLQWIKPQLNTDAYNKVKTVYTALFHTSCRRLLWEQLYSLLQTAQREFIAAQTERLARPIREAQSYIAEHYTDTQLNLNTAAEKAGLSTVYFSSLFKKQCGIGFAEYVQNLRMEHAKLMLTGTAHSIKHIAYKTGYADPKHFAKVFKSYTGITPNEYRRLYE